MCACSWLGGGHICHGTCGEVRGQLCRMCCLLLPFHVAQESHSGYQAFVASIFPGYITLPVKDLRTNCSHRRDVRSPKSPKLQSLQTLPQCQVSGTILGDGYPEMCIWHATVRDETIVSSPWRIRRALTGWGTACRSGCWTEPRREEHRRVEVAQRPSLTPPGKARPSSQPADCSCWREQNRPGEKADSPTEMPQFARGRVEGRANSLDYHILVSWL